MTDKNSDEESELTGRFFLTKVTAIWAFGPAIAVAVMLGLRRVGVEGEIPGIIGVVLMIGVLALLYNVGPRGDSCDG